jgi:hypothetical protein
MNPAAGGIPRGVSAICGRRLSWSILAVLGTMAVDGVSAQVQLDQSHPGDVMGAEMDREVDPCAWAAATGETLLGRPIGAVALADASLTTDLMRLLHRRAVPISFLEADKDSRITLHFADPTLREVLDAVIVQAPVYRYAFIRGHLVLYPRISPYELPLADFTLALTPRLKAAFLLVTELNKRHSAFARLESPMIVGDINHFIYDDQVAISGAANVLDGLVQLLGNRPSAVFDVILTRWRGRDAEPGQRYLDLVSAEVVQSVSVKPAIKSLRVGETVRLQVIATLAGGASQDVTAAACGTTYIAANSKVATVDENGMVRALTPGAEEIVVHNELQSGALIFKVTAGTAAAGAPKASVPQEPPR